MDAVITYVNGLDPVWQEQYARTVGLETLMKKRFRDWGTLKYLLRGIQEHMPFVENVYLIVSGRSQVPEWADESNLHIVLHEDIIPEEFLPVFNSTAIETYMYRIPGLAEEFIYFNDDFFPVMDCCPEDFFQDGKAVFKVSRHLIHSSIYKKHVRNADVLARKAAGVASCPAFIRPQHICTPLFKSACEEVFSKVGDDITDRVSRLRTDFNINYYIYSDYMYFTGRTISRKLSKKHFSLAAASMKRVCAFMADPNRKLMCVNDVHITEDVFNSYRTMWLEAFEKTLPKKSRFEL